MTILNDKEKSDLSLIEEIDQNEESSEINFSFGPIIPNAINGPLSGSFTASVDAVSIGSLSIGNLDAR